MSWWIPEQSAGAGKVDVPTPRPRRGRPPAQVSAHGTGARIPPVDEQVVAMKLVTPAQGTLRLSADTHPELFKCGLSLPPPPPLSQQLPCRHL